MARRFHRLLPSKFRFIPPAKLFCSSSATDPTTQTQLLEELRKIRVLIQQNRTETAKRHLQTLISLHSVSQLYDPVFTDTLLTVYAESKFPNEAAEVYSLVRSDGNFPSLSAFNLFLESLVNSNQFDRTLKIFFDAVDSGVWVDKFSMGKRYNPRNVAPNRVTYNSLIDGYCKAGDLEGAFNLREKMKNDKVEPNIVTYNTLLGGLCKMGRMEEANTVLEEMSVYGFVPDGFTYSILFDGHSRRGDVEASMTLYEDAMKKGMSMNEYTCSILMNGLCKEGKMDRAEEFLMMLKERGVVLTEVILNTMVNGYCKVGHVDKALLAIEEMENEGKRFAKCPDIHMLIDGHCIRGNIKDAFKVFDEMLRSDISPTIVTYNALVNGLSKKGRVAEAEELAFSVTNKGLSPDVITYNSLISGFSSVGNLEKCLELYEKMKTSGVKPTLTTYHPLISICKKDGLDHVEKIVEEMSHSFSALWHGHIQKANNLCSEMLNLGIPPDKMTYNSLIMGRLKEEICRARDLFGDMIAKGLAPNDATFNTLIEGHCKLKDFDGGHMWYKEMLKIGFLPSISVCDELLSGLREEGRFKEAEIISSEMSIKGVDESLHEDLSAAP
ncbi:hypothetical protein Pfo_028674 [Paulownia fortunei]|nr:hypothetical protein Pfo_028674 [Paulownia fortunei]